MRSGIRSEGYMLENRR